MYGIERYKRCLIDNDKHKGAKLVKMNAEHQITVNQIRALARSSRGQSQNILALNDEAIYQIYHQLQSGAGNRSTARFLREKFNVGGSENSIQQSIGKLKKKIEPLLRTAPRTVPKTSLEAKVKEIEHLPHDKKLATLEQIERDYRELINNALNHSREAGVLSSDLHKHIAALATISKTRAQLEKDSIANPGRPASFYESEEAQRIMKRRSDLVLEHYIGEDGDKMIKAAWDFLAEAEKHVIKMNLNPETGEYEPVKPYKKPE
jgi:hypothetical protein